MITSSYNHSIKWDYVLFPGLQSDTYQEDIYPMTAGTEPALSANEWLSGINRGKRSARSLLALCFTNINVQPDPVFWQRKCCNATQACISSWFSALWSAFTRCRGAYGPHTDTVQTKQLHLRSLLFLEGRLTEYTEVYIFFLFQSSTIYCTF